jgi:tRNA (guanine37-N1)-methyltransferase
MLTVNVVTLFPEVLAPALAASIPGRAATAGLVQFRLVQLRDFARDRHATVDDYAYGGGAGMVLKPEPVVEAVESLGEPGLVLLMSARGRTFTHADAVRYSLAERITVVCGHYKDVDQRVVDLLGAEEVSLGDFVLSGGEPAALCVIDAVVRLLPGAIGDHESASADSHYDGLLSPPSYTRPPEFRGLAVPEVLRSGDHAAIERWRLAEAERLTKERRPDLWAKHEEGSSVGERPTTSDAPPTTVVRLFSGG